MKPINSEETKANNSILCDLFSHPHLFVHTKFIFVIFSMLNFSKNPTVLFSLKEKNEVAAI